MTTGRINQVTVVCESEQPHAAHRNKPGTDARPYRVFLTVSSYRLSKKNRHRCKRRAYEQRVRRRPSQRPHRTRVARTALSRSGFLVQLCNREPRLRSLRRRPSDKPSSARRESSERSSACATRVARLVPLSKAG